MLVEIPFSNVSYVCCVQDASIPVPRPLPLLSSKIVHSHPLNPQHLPSFSSPTPSPTTVSKMITEVAIFELASPANVSDPSSPTASTIRTFLTAVLAADGAHAAYFSQSAEEPDTVVMFIDWDSTDAHNRFLASPWVHPFIFSHRGSRSPCLV